MGGGILLGFVLVLALMVGLRWQQTQSVSLSSKLDSAVFKLFPKPIPVPAAELTNKLGKPVVSDQLLDKKWTFLYFGYTLCPDICPTELTVLAEVAEQLRKHKVASAWQVVFVSVDADRDTPERLKGFVDYFDPQIQAATGSDVELRVMSQPIGVGWDKVATSDAQGKLDDSGYLINHTTSIYLVDPRGRAVGVFSSPHDPESMVKAYQIMVPD